MPSRTERITSFFATGNRLARGRFWGSVRGFVDMSVNMIWPPRCVVTGDIVDHQGMLSAAAWERLRFIGAPYCAQCGIPFEFEVDKEAEVRCAACLDHPPAFQAARAALVYDDVSRDIMLRYKHADQTHIVHSFIPWLRRAGADVLSDADYLVPVPLHRWRFFRRRYNQAALIGQFLGRACDITHIPDALMRVRPTKPQGKMNAKRRRANVRKAFRLQPKYAANLAGKHVVLIDDVFTTGATAGECAKTLLAGGVARVSVLSVARVVRD